MEMIRNDTNKKLSRYSKWQKRNFPFVYLLIAFPVIQFAVFWAYVNFSSIVMAFQDVDGSFTLTNFKTVYEGFTTTNETRTSLMDSFGRSMLIWTLELVICFPCSLITVYVLTCKIRGHYVYRVCYILPGLIGSVIWSTLVMMFMQQEGPLIELLLSLGAELPPEALHSGLLGAAETAFPSLLTFTIATSLVGSGPIFTGAYARISEEIMESADLDGAGFWTKLFAIAIPCIWSTITTMLIFRLCSIFTADCGVFLYSGGDGEPAMSTIGFQLFYLTREISLSADANPNYGYPAALGFTLTIMTLPICLIGKYFLEKLNDAVES